MSKLNELMNIVNEAFNASEDVEQIKTIQKYKDLVEGAIVERDELEKSQSELKQEYVKLLKEVPAGPSTDTTIQGEPDRKALLKKAGLDHLVKVRGEF